MSVVNASNHHSLVVVPLDNPVATTKYVLAWRQRVVLSECRKCRILVLVDGGMLDGREDRVRVTLRCPKVLQDGRDIGGSARAKSCGHVLVTLSTHG
jgi:hypothetical protein